MKYVQTQCSPIGIWDYDETPELDQKECSPYPLPGFVTSNRSFPMDTRDNDQYKRKKHNDKYRVAPRSQSQMDQMHRSKKQSTYQFWKIV